ncbi:hypothetical protein [Sphingomonas crusticola]|uniref:hypothetical protein n=1 Tax=Sphingomonas crusticola TaxID=1697973 RepID=UPI000E256891|nr:hypothetical protein [Sphingomonas crusticola]
MTTGFAWAMHNGAKLLFAVAIFVALLSFLPVALGALDAGQARDRLWLIVAAAANALSSAVLPFLGALLIDRLDHWREHRA